MPGAIIAFDQARPGPSFGSPGVARKDIWIGRLVTCRCTTSGNVSFEWVILDKPPGSAATLTDDATANATLTPDLPGPYRIQLTTNGGGPGNVQILILGVRFDFNGTQVNRGWLPPAFGEVQGENNWDGNVRGYAPGIEYILTDLLSVIGTGGSGGQVVSVKDPAVTADYVCTSNDNVISVDSTGGSLFVDLMPAAPVGQSFSVHDVGGACGTNPVIVRPPGGENIISLSSWSVAVNFAEYSFIKLSATRWGVK
jgi:hypothetical protein